MQDKILSEKSLLEMVNVKGVKAYKVCKAAIGRREATKWLLKMIGEGKYRPN